MKKFEAYLTPEGEVEVRFPVEGETILLDSARGRDFAAELIQAIRARYPYMVMAIEQKVKHDNRSLHATMMQNTTTYTQVVGHTICACGFGERDELLDFDGERFHFEYPRQCRQAKYCPWCGYRKGNEDRKMVICGARREYGLTPQERRAALLVQQGFTAPAVIADVLCVTQKSVWNILSNIYRKTGCEGMPELLIRLKDERL